MNQLDALQHADHVAAGSVLIDNGGCLSEIQSVTPTHYRTHGDLWDMLDMKLSSLRVQIRGFWNKSLQHHATFSKLIVVSCTQNYLKNKK